MDAKHNQKKIYQPPPWKIRLECERLRKKRKDGIKGKRRRDEPGAIREYTWIELGLQGPLDFEEL